MRVVALEEHVSFPEFLNRLPKEAVAARTLATPPDQVPLMKKVAPLLADTNKERLEQMDAHGVSVQVLSISGTGAEVLPPDEGPAFAKEYNDAVAARVREHPDRFAAFAHLPMTNPEAAADELERTVKTHGFKGAMINGTTQDQFLDDLKFSPIFERAEALDVPVYLHPGIPPKAVVNAYYSNLPGGAAAVLATAGFGWHAETAIHLLRLIITGVFDRYPKLNIIIGHMGEMLPVAMARTNKMFAPTDAKNQRSVIETLKDQVYITTSGIFTLPPLQAALDTFGIDRILFSIDYPFSPNEPGEKFLQSAAEKLSREDLEKLAHRNADRLLKLTV